MPDLDLSPERRLTICLLPAHCYATQSIARNKEQRTSLTWTKGKESWLVPFRRRIQQLRDQPVGVHRVVVDQLGKGSKPRLSGHEVIGVVTLLDAVVVDATLVPERDGPLSGRRLRFPDQERSVDSGTEEVFGRVPGDRSVIPGVFLEGVDRRDVVGRDPTDGPCRVVSLAPLARLVVAQDPDL